MKEQLEKVIRKIILPHYPMINDIRIESHVSGVQNTYAVFYRMYDVELATTNIVSNLIHETQSLFSMLAPNYGYDYLAVRFEWI